MTKSIYLSLLLVLTFTIQNTQAQYTDVINSNRPGESFGAFAVGKTIFQTEGGLSYINEKYKANDAKVSGIFADLDIRYGFWKEELEFIADLQYQHDTYKVPSLGSESRSYLRTTTLGFKYLVYDPFKNYEEEINVRSWKANHRFKWRQFIPAVAIYAGVNFNFDNNPYIPEDQSLISPKAMIALQNHFSGGWVFVTNLIANHITSDYRTLGGILTATKSFDAKWSGFAEIQGYTSDYYKDIIFRGGAAYLLADDLQLDISIGKNIHDSRNIIYAGIGASWRFTLNYEDVVIYKSTPAEDDKKGKDKNSNTEELQDSPVSE